MEQAAEAQKRQLTCYLGGEQMSFDDAFVVGGSCHVKEAILHDKESGSVFEKSSLTILFMLWIL